MSIPQNVTPPPDSQEPPGPSPDDRPAPRPPFAEVALGMVLLVAAVTLAFHLVHHDAGHGWPAWVAVLLLGTAGLWFGWPERTGAMLDRVKGVLPGQHSRYPWNGGGPGRW